MIYTTINIHHTNPACICRSLVVLFSISNTVPPASIDGVRPSTIPSRTFYIPLCIILTGTQAFKSSPSVRDPSLCIAKKDPCWVRPRSKLAEIHCWMPDISRSARYTRQLLCSLCCAQNTQLPKSKRIAFNANRIPFPMLFTIRSPLPFPYLCM